jgi:hypothetical protein
LFETPLGRFDFFNSSLGFLDDVLQFLDFTSKWPCKYPPYGEEEEKLGRRTTNDTSIQYIFIRFLPIHTSPSKMKLSFVTAFICLKSIDAFSIQGQNKSLSKVSNTKLYFGIPTFGAGKKEVNDDEKSVEGAPEKKIGLSGLVQLITAGMGSPFLGDFEGVEEETGKLLFSLEANNLVDEQGRSKQTSMPYFESGWVDEEEEQKKKEKGGFKFW